MAAASEGALARAGLGWARRAVGLVEALGATWQRMIDCASRAAGWPMGARQVAAMERVAAEKRGGGARVFKNGRVGRPFIGRG